MLLTFKIEVGPTLQEDSSCPGQAQLSHLQQRTAHAFLVEWRVSLLLQQLSEDKDPALLAGSVTAPRARTEEVGTLGGGGAVALACMPFHNHPHKLRMLHVAQLFLGQKREMISKLAVKGLALTRPLSHHLEGGPKALTLPRQNYLLSASWA